MSNIIKKKNKYGEPYANHKLFASIKASCLSVATPIGAAEDAARHVCTNVENWLENKAEVTSLDIRVKASEHLNQLNPDAAYMYQNERII